MDGIALEVVQLKDGNYTFVPLDPSTLQYTEDRRQFLQTIDGKLVQLLDCSDVILAPVGKLPEE